MIQAVRSVSSLLLGMAILLAGSGLIGTLLGLRASAEGFGGFTLGLVMSGFFAGYILGAFVTPPLIRRVGHIRTFTAMAALAAVVCMLYGLWVDPLVWWVLRVLNGIAMVSIYMVIESWLNEQMHEQRSKIFAAYMMVSFMALGAGQFLVGLYGAGQLASFVLVGVCFSLGLIPIALTPVTQPTPIDTHRLPLAHLYRVSPVGFFAGTISGLLSGAFWGLAAAFATQQGLDDADVATLTAAAIFGGALMQWPIGKLSEGRDRRRVLAVVATLAILSAVAMFLVGPHSAPGLIAATACYGSFAFSLYGLAVAQTHDRFHPSEALEATKALLLLSGIGAAVGPIMAGGIMSLAGPRSLPLILAVQLLVLLLLTAWRIRRDAPVAPADRTGFMPLHRTSPAATDMDPRIPHVQDALAESK